MKSTNTDKQSFSTNSKIASDVADILIDIGAIIFRPNQPFEFKSGILSPVYTDNRLLISYPEKWNKVINYFVQKIREIGIPDIVAGVATAGVPHAALVASKLKIPMIYARPIPKRHGLDKQVEGVLKRGQSVIVIDDLISTGMSSLGVVDGIRKMGGSVTDQLAIFTYNLKEANTNYIKYKVKLHALTDLEHAVKAAEIRQYLRSTDQVSVILDWARDPKGWAKKMGFSS